MEAHRDLLNPPIVAWPPPQLGKAPPQSPCSLSKGLIWLATKIARLFCCLFCCERGNEPFSYSYQTITFDAGLYRPQATLTPPSQEEAYYFHTTTRTGLQGILDTQNIAVRHGKRHKGAFFSSHPETMFGNYVIGMKRTIEKVNRSLTASGITEGHYWGGFNQAIPITRETVRFIALPRRLSSRDIVIPPAFKGIPFRALEDIQEEVSARDQQDGLIIPSHWYAGSFQVHD